MGGENMGARIFTDSEGNKAADYFEEQKTVLTAEKGKA